MRIRRKYRRRRFIFFTAILIILLIITSSLYVKMRPTIRNLAQSNAETILLDAANTATLNIFDKDDISYGDIVNLSKNTEGHTTGLEINIVKINSLKSRISNEISDIIKKNDRYYCYIPIGTFFANEYTTGLGPDIKFSMQMTSTSVVDFESEFSSVGINQTLHKIVINIDINARLIMAGVLTDFTVHTSTIAAQTVIVGSVPDAITDIREEESDNTAGLINDYEAAGVKNGY